MSVHQRLRRSFLYVPPAYPAALAGSRALPADIVCYDLEDATPPEAKVAARDAVAAHIGGVRDARETLVRVNALETEWGHADLRFVASLPVDGVLLPKVEADAGVRQARAVLAAAGRADMAIWCLIETPLGVLRVEQIASSGAAGLVVGAVDLAEGLNARAVPSRLPLWHALSQVVLAARAFGIAAIDAATMGPPEAVKAACGQAVDLGFDGKSVFNAAGLEIVNRLFSPGEADIAAARKALAGGGGYGAHIEHARRVLAFAELAGATEREERA